MKAYCQHLIDIDGGRVFELKSINSLVNKLVRLDSFLETIRLEVLSCKLRCLGCAAKICGSITRLKWALASDDRGLNPWSNSPADDDPVGECRMPLNFGSEVTPNHR